MEEANGGGGYSDELPDFFLSRKITTLSQN